MLTLTRAGISGEPWQPTRFLLLWASLRVTPMLDFRACQKRRRISTLTSFRNGPGVHRFLTVLNPLLLTSLRTFPNFRLLKSCFRHLRRNRAACLLSLEPRRRLASLAIRRIADVPLLRQWPFVRAYRH
jgi:hypothetical protein